MRIRVFLFLFALGLAGLVGCSSSTPTPKEGGVTAPPPQNSGAGANVKGGKARLPGPQAPK